MNCMKEPWDLVCKDVWRNLRRVPCWSHVGLRWLRRTQLVQRPWGWRGVGPNTEQAQEQWIWALGEAWGAGREEAGGMGRGQTILGLTCCMEEFGFLWRNLRRTSGNGRTWLQLVFRKHRLAFTWLTECSGQEGAWGDCWATAFVHVQTPVVA